MLLGCFPRADQLLLGLIMLLDALLQQHGQYIGILFQIFKENLVLNAYDCALLQRLNGMTPNRLSCYHFLIAQHGAGIDGRTAQCLRSMFLGNPLTKDQDFFNGLPAPANEAAFQECLATNFRLCLHRKQPQNTMARRTMHA